MRHISKVFSRLNNVMTYQADLITCFGPACMAGREEGSSGNSMHAELYR
jgi:hypothetical protein